MSNRGKRRDGHITIARNVLPYSDQPLPSWRTCQFISGEPSANPDYCGAPSLPGESWCEHHHHIVWRIEPQGKRFPHVNPITGGYV